MTSKFHLGKKKFLRVTKNELNKILNKLELLCSGIKFKVKKNKGYSESPEKIVTSGLGDTDIFHFI